MDIQVLKDRREGLDPKAHGSLIQALTAQCDERQGSGQNTTRQDEPTPDPFAEMFEKAVDDINKRYIEGTDDYIRKLHPDVYQKTNQAEDKLNEVWKAGLEGKARIEEFRPVLEEWSRLHLRSIEIYSREHKKEEA